MGMHERAIRPSDESVDQERPRRKGLDNSAAALEVATRACVIRRIRTGTRGRTPEVICRINGMAVLVDQSTVVVDVIAKDVVRSNRAGATKDRGTNVYAGTLVADGCVSHERKVRRINEESIDIANSDIESDYQAVLRIELEADDITVSCITYYDRRTRQPGDPEASPIIVGGYVVRQYEVAFEVKPRVTACGNVGRNTSRPLELKAVQRIIQRYVSGGSDMRCDGLESI
jgi:hypothetical protein